MTGFLERAEALFPYSQALRRDFHQHPELAFQETRTSRVVARELEALGLEVVTGIAGTGVLGLLRGSRPGPVILLRFDMDALPITEQNEVPYASQNPGAMHACGHDAHTAIGLTVARLLHDAREDLSGVVKFAFQPAEERANGAEAMIQAGILEGPRAERTLALHLWNHKSVGWLGIAPGPIMAGAEEFKITVRGKGGHGAIPQDSVDPIVAGAHIVTALQTIVSRNVSPLQTAVVSVTTFHGGDAYNVIPPAVEMMGTIRTFQVEIRDLVLDRFRHVIHGVAGSLGCEAVVEYGSSTPAVVNDPDTARIVQAAARRILPGHDVDDTAPITMGAEDYSYFLREIPGCFFFIGSANPERGLDYGHHHPRFDFDEVVLPRGAALMAQAAVDLMGQTTVDGTGPGR